MKKIALFTLLALFVAAMLLGFVWQANAQATQITGLTSEEYDCAALQTLEPWFTGNVMHIRGYVHVNVEISDSPYLAGINTTVANAEINGKSGNVTIRGTMHLEPTAYPGSTWEGNWVFISSKGTSFGRAVAQGTGDLEGMTLFLDLYDWTDFDQDDANAACASVSYDGQPVYPEASHTKTEATILISSRP